MIQAIVNPNHQIQFPRDGHDPLLLDVIQCCLVRDPARRPSIADMLEHPYVVGGPQADNRNKDAVSAVKLLAGLSLEGVLTPNTLDRTKKGLTAALQVERALEEVSARLSGSFKVHIVLVGRRT